MHGHCWTTLNGIQVTLFGLALTLLTTKMARKDTPNFQHAGLRISSRNTIDDHIKFQIQIRIRITQGY